MKVCVYQPNVFPPLHYFNRIMNSDVWVMLNDVQLNRKVGQTRFFLKVGGQALMTAVPVPGGNRVNIADAAIDYDAGWAERLAGTIEHAYGKSPFFEAIRSAVDYIESHRRMNSDFRQFCEPYTVDMLRKLGWRGRIVGSAGLAGELKASERMAEIVRLVGGTCYICGDLGFRNYVDMEHFRSRGLSVAVQNWTCPAYPQGKGAFIPNLSILDLIAHVGPEEAGALLAAGGTDGWPVHE